MRQKQQLLNNEMLLILNSLQYNRDNCHTKNYLQAQFSSSNSLHKRFKVLSKLCNINIEFKIKVYEK